MSKSRQIAVSDLVSNVDGLVQLANWQIALAREVRNQVAALDKLPTDESRAVAANSQRRKSARTPADEQT
jgi:hypothetical protein